MNLLICLVLTLRSISLGCCDDATFSLCWMSKGEVLERQSANILLNGTSLKNIQKEAKVTTLTVSSTVENKLTLEYGGSVQKWTFIITPHKHIERTKFTLIKGRRKPLQEPISSTKAFLDMMGPSEVFACENVTLFFHQDENFFLAIGHTMRLPVKLQSSTASMLLLSWVENPSAVSSTMSLYHTELGSYDALSTDSTTNNHYSFTALDSCSRYVACVEIADTHSLTCLSAFTDPDIPKNFKVTSWNTSSISLAWDCPENCKFSVFLLTTFYLNETDHVIKAAPLLNEEDNFVFILSDLQPCSRVKFGLQTVCQVGVESRYSKMLLNDGNSGYSSIKALRQTSSGPDSYTLSWEVRNTSSISNFRVYHEGALHGTTLITNYTVRELLPCQQYQVKVEALCGDGMLMSAKEVTAHTGPHGVSEQKYRNNDSTVLWQSNTTYKSLMAFLYDLSLENATTLQSTRVGDAKLPLPGLEEGKYILEVWKECANQWESEHSRVSFEGANLALEHLLRATGLAMDQEVVLDASSMVLMMVLPWSLPDDLQAEELELREEMEKIFKNKLQNLFKDFDQPVRFELVTFEPANDKTEILFMSFDASENEDLPLPVEDQLNYIQSLNTTDITVRDGVIYWDGPDVCTSLKKTLCPDNSLCINTLGSYTCVCKLGYYDVSSLVEPPDASHPFCSEKGLFSLCLDKRVTGGIAKPFLTSYVGGRVDVKLNDGRCTVQEKGIFYYFHVSRKGSECGTGRRVNKTHIEFQNTLTVTLGKEQTISRRDLKVVWKCVYPRHYVSNSQVAVDMQWLSMHSLVEFSSSLQLGLTMTLYTDESYTSSYRDAINLGLEDILFFQVALQTNNSFAPDVLLWVESCWATESTDPQDTVQGVLLQDGCPVDYTFHWHSVNGVSQKSQFSIQMFHMPKGLPFYIHCLTSICGHNEDCVKNCSSQQRSKRSVDQMDRKEKQGVVSAGPLVVNPRAKSRVSSSYWAEHITMISIVAGSIGFLGLTVLSVSATKAIMTYYERCQLK